MPPLDAAVAISPGTRSALPRSYMVWLAGTRVSLAGDAALAFALGWAAGAHGGRSAAMVLTAITVPRTVLLLLGGAVGDRFGARRMMIIGDAAMLSAVLALAVTSRLYGTQLWLLLVFAGVIGTVDAFYLPAAGSMPRRLVVREQLHRALALRQAGDQVASLLGAPLGTVLVLAGGLTGTALVDAATFAAVLVVVVRVRPLRTRRPSRSGSLSAGIAEGVRLAVTDRVLRPALLLTATAAAGLLPVISLLSPLLARSHGWGPASAGLMVTGQGVGVLLSAVAASRLGPLRRAGVGASVGLGIAAAGIATLAAAPATGPAVAAGLIVGMGSGMFACHVGPLILATAPDSHLARIQSVLTLVQSAALVAATMAWGSLADLAGIRTATAVCAGVVCAAGIGGLLSPTLRLLRHSAA